MITATKARAITEEVIKDSKNVWLQLEKTIEKAAKAGKSMVIFTTKPGFEFVEGRKAVKENLESYGYSVEYRKYDNGDYDYGNIYTIRW